MQDSWGKYLLALVALGALVSFLYYLSVRTPAQQAGPDGGESSSTKLDSFTNQLPDFDFYKFLPETEELVPEPPRPEQDSTGQDSTEQDSNPAVSGVEGLIFQVGAYQDKREANRHRAEMLLLNLPVRIEQTSIDSQTWHRLRIGPVQEGEFERIRQRLAQHQIEYFLSRPKPVQ